MLPQKERLKKSSEFSAVYNHKKSVANSLLILYTGWKKHSNNELTKVGFVVGKKISKRATKRNKIKRFMRESYKKVISEENMNIQWNKLIFLARPNILDVEFKDVYDNIIDCLKKAEKRYGYHDLGEK